jgi:hypothetical protein
MDGHLPIWLISITAVSVITQVSFSGVLDWNYVIGIIQRRYVEPYCYDFGIAQLL